MIILDENSLDGQRLMLEGWKISNRQVGLDVGRKGLKDEEIVILLGRLRQPTFFTRDQGFYSAELWHQALRHRGSRRGTVRAGSVRPPSPASQGV